MTTFVLVPGACHGGWWYETLATRLADAGHTAVAVTPAGLDPDVVAPHAAITLDTHVSQVAAAVRDADGSGRDIVLVGHGYGGAVVTGAADAEPDRVRALVYLDAFVPDDGDSCWSLADDAQRRWYVEGAGHTGVVVDPPPFSDGRARPHPLASLVQRSRLTGAWRTVPVRHHVVALGWPDGSPLAASHAKLRDDPAATVHEWDTGHDVLHEAPDRVLDLLRDL